MTKTKEKRKIEKRFEPNSDKVYQVLKPCKVPEYYGKVWETYGRKYTPRGLMNFIKGNTTYDFVIEPNIRQEIEDLTSKV